jgi:hypothetical protein
MWFRSFGPVCVLVAVGSGLLTVPARAYVTDQSAHPPASYDSFQPPNRGLSYQDPVFGTEIWRLSDALRTANTADGGSLTWVMDEYSTISAFNQDRSLLLLQHDSYFALYDGQGSYLRDLPYEIHASSEPRWSRRENGVLYFLNGNRLRRYDVATGALSTVRTFSEYQKVSGNGEADICFDGDHLVLTGDGRHVFVYEIGSDTKGRVLDTGGRGIDSVYITPDDNVTVTWLQSGSSRYNGVELFDRNMSFLRQLTRAGGHMDVTRDASGEEVLVWTNSADPNPICDNGVVKVRLRDGSQSCLVSLDWSLGVHISCPDGSGACFVGTYAPSDPSPNGSWPAYTNELLQVLLDGSEVRRLAHHRSRPFNGYNYMARATVSRDGARLLYSSNYGLQASGAPTEYSDTYLIAVSGAGPTSGGSGGDVTDTGTGGSGGGAGGTVRTEEDATSLAYSEGWFPNSMAVHSGGGARLAMDPGSRARFTFEGTGVRWVGYRDEWSGIARVYLDGALAATVDTYASPAQPQAVLFAKDGLAASTHTIEIEATGGIGSASSGAWIWIDAFDVTPSSGGGGGTTGGSGTGGTGGDPGGSGGGSSPGSYEEDAAGVVLAGGWQGNASPQHSAGHAVLAMDRGSSATLRFQGTGISWIGFRDRWSGVAKVFLDGVLVRKVNTFASSDRAQQTLFSVTGLQRGEHTITIEVTGYHSKRSKGSWIWLDRFDVRP